MKKILSILALGAIVFASCDNSPKFTVEGSISDAADSMLYLQHNSLEGIKTIDSTKLSSTGTFSFKAAAPDSCPDFYSLRVGKHVINFSIDSTETVKFTASLPTMESAYTVEGSDNCERIRQITLMQQDVQKKIIAVEKNDALYPGDMVDSVRGIINAYKSKITYDYIVKNPAAASSYYAVCQSLVDRYSSFMLFNPVSDRSDVKVYAAVATAWDANYHNAPRTQQLCNMTIKGMDNTAVPQHKVIEVDENKISETGIIDINLPDANSNFHSIHDLKGKVVLIDFTMYSAPESPERTSAMRTLYNKYKSRGFEIYQISLDNDTHFWKYSCEKLPWICVHETDGTTVNTYNVVNLPTFFLVNRKNEIVVRSEFMEGSLEDNIEKIL